VCVLSNLNSFKVRKALLDYGYLMKRLCFSFLVSLRCFRLSFRQRTETPSHRFLSHALQPRVKLQRTMSHRAVEIKSTKRQLPTAMLFTNTPSEAKRRPIFVFDTETTGLTSADRLVEIAVAELSITLEKKCLLSFSSLIHPKGVEIPRAATRIHGITNAMLQDAPHFRAAWKGFEEYIKHASEGRGRPILVAHNLPFDLRFIKEELKRIDSELPPWDFADSLGDIARVLWPSERGSLAALVERFGIVNDEEHRALCDVEATCAVLKKADEVLESRAKAEGKENASTVKTGDCIYEMIVKAADKHNKKVAPLWRNESEYLEHSLTDSTTEHSASPRTEFSTSADSLMNIENRSPASEELYEAPNGSVYHVVATCVALKFSAVTSAVSQSERAPCRLCAGGVESKSPAFPAILAANNLGISLAAPYTRRVTRGSETHEEISKRFLPMENSEEKHLEKEQAYPSSAATAEETLHQIHLPEAPVYFTASGECYHVRRDCYGLRTAFTIRSAVTVRQGQRPCQVCCGLAKDATIH
jgi:DNA polymerase III epsilon subunit family exonuclease